MSSNMQGTFGEFFRRKRIEQGLTLREFCRKHGFDPGNISKLERGVLPAPQSEETRRRYADALGIAKGSDDWLTFCDRAAAESGTLPSDVTNDENVLRHLPVLFRTIRDAKLSAEELQRLIEIVREESK